MEQGKRRRAQRTEPVEEPDVDLEERHDECRRSPLVCIATCDEDC